MVLVCERLERAHGLAPGSLRFEIQVETPQAVLGADGTALVARMIHASARRCTGLHYGTYDYSASCGIAAAYQSMEHPVADHAKAVMQVAAAGTGVRLSDGSTNRLPVGDRAAVLAAWRLHARLVRRSLERGFYQGWDLHPAQLPSRYVAVFAFYREGLPAAAARLRAYLGRERLRVPRRAGDGARAGRLPGPRGRLRRERRRGGAGAVRCVPAAARRAGPAGLSGPRCPCRYLAGVGHGVDGDGDGEQQQRRPARGRSRRRRCRAPGTTSWRPRRPCGRPPRSRTRGRRRCPAPPGRRRARRRPSTAPAAG